VSVSVGGGLTVADRTFEFLLVAKDEASRALGNIGDASSKASTKAVALGSMLGGLGANLIGGGIQAVGSVISDAFAASVAPAKSAALLNNEIANLGPAAQEAFSGASDFAGELGNNIGQDDDDIKKVQAKLASFPDAFRQGSDGADAMKRATAAAFDLQALGIGDAESNILGIGKALNDPIKGMSALAKSGVSFTAVQKEQIKNAMAHGDLAKAQKILLEGIESNAKGAAAATVTNTQKLTVAFGNLTEGVAGALMPAIQQVAGFVLDKLPAIGDFFNGISYYVEGFIDMLMNGTDGADDWINGMGLGPDSPVLTTIDTIRTVVANLVPTLTTYFNQIKAAVLPALQGIWKTIQTDVIPALSAFVTAAIPIVKFLVEKLGPVVASVFGTILTVIKGALQIISGVLNVFAGLFTGDWSRMWKGVQQILGGAWTIIKSILSTAMVALRAGFEIGWAAVKAVFSRAWEGIKGMFSSAGSWFSGIGQRIIDGLIGGINAGFQRVKSTLSSLTNLLPSWKGPESRDKSLLTPAGALIIDGLIGGFESRYGAARDSLSGFTDSMAGAGGSGRGGYAGGARGGVTVYLSGVVGDEHAVVRKLQEAFNRADLRGYGVGAAL
jgi:hypothetical protein